MDIYEYAKNNEKQMEYLYEHLADIAGHPGLTRIFKLIAEEERKHYDIIQKMERNEEQLLEPSKLIETSKTILEESKGNDYDPTELLQMKQVDIYKEAQQLEKDSMDFYSDKAEKSDNPDHQRILNILAGEEKKHFYFLDNFIEMLDRPFTWMEDAEFYHLDQY